MNARRDDDRLSPPDTKAGRLQREALRVLREHEASGMLPTSIRFVFYELEQQGIVSKVATGARRPDQDLADAILDLRDRNIVPWNWISDETRSVTEWSTSPTVMEGVIDAVEDVRIHRWGREHPPLLVTESRSLAGVLDTLAYMYAAPITSTNGQTRGHLENEVAPVYGRGRRVLYLGDWDLSGGHIEANTRRVLEMAEGLPVQWERLAITQPQIEERRLTPIMKTDKRYKGRGGRHQAWECEALSQATIVEIVRAQLNALLPESLAVIQAREDAERVQVRRRLQRLNRD
jgi:hypothetical protein